MVCNTLCALYLKQNYTVAFHHQDYNFTSFLAFPNTNNCYKPKETIL